MMKKASTAKLLTAVQEGIKRHKLITPNDRLLLGVSGGPDSVALLDILFQLRHEFGFSLAVAHFNHNLRKGADADEKFTGKLSQKYNVPFFAGSWQYTAKTMKSNIEEKAREARLTFFKKTLSKHQFSKIVLAHTENDVAETFLMRVIRGSGLQGLQAILPKKEIDGLTVIRPLLTVRKTDLLSYLKEQKLAYRVDPTNNQSDFTRNKVRNQLLPELSKSYNPNIISTLAVASVNTAADYAFLHSYAENIFTKIATPKNITNKVAFPLKSFSAKHEAIQKMLIRIAFHKLNGSLNQLNFQHWAEISDLIHNRPAGSVVNLPKSIKAVKRPTVLSLER